jgi:hypothetical protein
MNPLRFGDIDLSIDRAYPEVPLNPNTTNINTPSVHREGEVWCGMLWEMRASLIARYGAVAGNDLALRLVTDALKLSPANPTFVQGRDAILQADLVNSGGLHRGEIWTAFAKRKMGSGAVAPPGGNLYTIGVVESATVPDALEVSNLDGWNFNLDPGGTTSASLTLRNTGTGSLNWSATPGAAWLQASPASGSLATGASVTLTVQASAAGLAPGRRSTMLVLRNEGTAFNQPVGARLNLAPPAVVRFNLETDPGWARSGEWAYGTPQGGGGAAAGGAGYPDPTVAATGAKVLGVNLSGNHSVAVTGPDHVTLGPVNLSAVRNTRLRFRQWLNMQPLTFANATIEVSTDGTTWRSLFATGYSGAADDAWRRMEYEIGPVADQQSATFSATIVNNALRDGSQPATVNASAAGYQSGALDLTIRDNDADSYTFAPIASPQRRNNAFVVTLTARDVNGEIIATPAGSVTLSGTAASGTVAFSPTGVGTFSNGVSSVSPTFTAAATGIVLTATDNFGRTGQSNAFDVVVVPLDHFDWSGLPPSGAVHARLNATVTAKDDSDAVSTGFNGSASLRAHVLYYDRTIGSPVNGSPQTSQVFNTTAQDSRATLLYTAEELGGAPGWLGAISFTMAASGSQPMSNFNIRLKLSPRTTMEGAAWETDGWTTVFTAPTQSGSTPNFAFTRPFWFDGTSSVLVDISFDNSTTGTATTLRYTPSANPRVLYGTSASAHGNPLNWSATTGPATQTSTELPAMDLYFARDLGQVPGSPAGFSSGVWTGQVAIPALGSTRRSLGDSPVGRSAWMLASEASGAMGFSPRILVNTVTSLPPSSSETIFSDNFESGSTLGPAWSTAGSFPIQGAPPTAPRAAITTVGTPRGTQHLVLDSSIVLSGFQAVLSAAEMSLNLTDRSNVTLEYWAKFMTGEVANNAPGTQPFTTSNGIFDGIAISADGTNWYLAAPTIYAEPLGAGVPNFILPTTYTAMRRVVLDPIVQRYGLSYNSTFRIKFLCVTGRPAPDAGIAIDDVVVKANATTAPALELPAQLAEGSTQNITVRLPSAPASNVTVNLVSNAPARLTVPASVIVLAGQTTATASISAPDNGFLDSGGGFGAIVTVTASGYPTSYANTFLTDNETGTLSLKLPAQITEGIDPPSNDGTVTITPAPTDDTSVTLTISDPAEAFITGTFNGSTTIGAATILAGTGSGRVHITPINDSRIDGQQSITVTASAPGATSGSTTVLVNDNEQRTLSFTLPPLIIEGGTGGGSVIIPGSMTTPLVVNLASSNPAKLTVPATVTIAAGNTASGFTLTTLNDTTDDGDLAVFITASAATFTSGSGPVTVRDNDPSYFEFANIGTQAPGVAFPVTINARSSGNDVVTAYTSTAALSASIGGKSLTITPTATTAFSSGAWTGNVTVNGIGDAVRLTATRSGTGAFGTSNPFALTIGPIRNSPSIQTSNGQQFLTLDYHRRLVRPGYGYVIETSQDLLSWSSSTGDVQEVSVTPAGDGLHEIVRIRVLPETGSLPRKFVRVRLVNP